MERQRGKMEVILIKPHHFLDMIKLYGAGYEKFVPDEANGHDFWQVGNRILEDPRARLELTLDNDAVCAPCRSNDGKKCVGTTLIVSGEMSKDGFNKMIDRRLLEKLNLAAGAQIASLELCRLARQWLTSQDIAEVWQEKPEAETRRRIELLLAGLNKYIGKYGE